MSVECTFYNIFIYMYIVYQLIFNLFRQLIQLELSGGNLNSILTYHKTRKKVDQKNESQEFNKVLNTR